MITVRLATERHHDSRRKQDVWRTFYPQDRPDPLADGFGTVAMLNESRLYPGASLPRYPHHNAEVITYVREGALAWEDSMGCSAVIQAGEFLRRTAGNGDRCRQRNASRTQWAHVFQIWLHSSDVGHESGHEQKRFSTAERRRQLCVVASPDARRESLRIDQDVLMYSSLLAPGQHVVHELSEGRRAWLHLVHGEATLGDLVLTAGDGGGVAAERAVSLTASTEAEILLLDLGDGPPRQPEKDRLAPSN